MSIETVAVLGAGTMGHGIAQVSAAIGSPEKVIAETAERQGSDLLVIARVAHPESPKELGSTARKVVDEIDTEVLILPVA